MTPPISLQCLLFVSLMLQIHIWGSLTAHSLGHCGLVWKASDQWMGRWREGEQVDSTGIYQSCGRMWMQKQRRTSRLKKHAWMPLKRPVLCRWLVSFLWLGASRACQISTVEFTSCICSFSARSKSWLQHAAVPVRREAGGDTLRLWTWHCPRNVCIVKGLVLHAPQSLNESFQI